MTPPLRKLVRGTIIATFFASAVSWVYFFIVARPRFDNLAFYVYVSSVAWLLLAGALFGLENDRHWVRVTGLLLLIPALSLWVVSVAAGFYGFMIH